MTGNVNVPKITAPTTQVYQPPTQAQPYQRDSYNYTPRQFSATPSSGRPVSAGGPVYVPRPVQGYQAPARTVDYGYKPQYTAGRTIESPQWAVPNYTPTGFSYLPKMKWVPDGNGNMITELDTE